MCWESLSHEGRHPTPSLSLSQRRSQILEVVMGIERGHRARISNGNRVRYSTRYRYTNYQITWYTIAIFSTRTYIFSPRVSVTHTYVQFITMYRKTDISILSTFRYYRFFGTISSTNWYTTYIYIYIIPGIWYASLDDTMRCSHRDKSRPIKAREAERRMSLGPDYCYCCYTYVWRVCSLALLNLAGD